MEWENGELPVRDYWEEPLLSTPQHFFLSVQKLILENPPHSGEQEVQLSDLPTEDIAIGQSWLTEILIRADADPGSLEAWCRDPSGLQSVWFKSARRVFQGKAF